LDREAGNTFFNCKRSEVAASMFIVLYFLAMINCVQKVSLA